MKIRLAYIVWISASMTAAGFFAQNAADRSRMVNDINAGHVLAWATHVTGQDFNDVSVRHNVESVCVIPGSSSRANGDARTDDEVWISTERVINGTTYRFVEQVQPLDWGPDPNYCWFVDGGKGGHSNGAAQSGTPATPATYEMTWFSFNGGYYGFPLTDTTLLTLSGSAVDKGSGIVGLTMTDHPYVTGDKVVINGTTNYEGSQTLTAETSANEICFADTYVAETLSGTETAILSVSGISSGFGRSAMDSNGDLYVGHTWSVANSTHITKVANNGRTITYNDFDNATWPISGNTANSIIGIAFSSDESSLYLGHYVEAATDYVWLEKFDVATGSLLWGVNVGQLAEYAMDLDANDNVYIAGGVGGIDSDIAWFASADGAKTNMNDVPCKFCVKVDDTLGIVAGGDRQSAGDPAIIYNLSVRKLDDSGGDKVAVGGTYFVGAHSTYMIGYGGIATDGQFIYVLLFDAFTATTPTTNSLYKYSWDGSSLTEVAAVPGPPYGVALYFDLYGNLCVVNQDNAAGQEDVIWFYDTDLNYVSKVDGIDSSVFIQWDPASGNGYIRGDATFDGALAQPAQNLVPGVTAGSMSMSAYPAGADFCVYADGRPIGTFQTVADANGTIVLDLGATYDVVIAGFNYFSILETFPLVTNTRYGLTQSRQTTIQDVLIDFQESMGAHVGASQTYSADWKFSYDDFATAIDPYTGYKGPAPFLRGTSREPVIYIWEWDPVPMCLRSIHTRQEVTFE